MCLDNFHDTIHYAMHVLYIKSLVVLPAKHIYYTDAYNFNSYFKYMYVTTNIKQYCRIVKDFLQY